MSDDLCKFCVVDTLNETLARANREMATMRGTIRRLEKEKSDAVADLYSVQEQLQLERTRHAALLAARADKGEEG